MGGSWEASDLRMAPGVWRGNSPPPDSTLVCRQVRMKTMGLALQDAPPVCPKGPGTQHFSVLTLHRTLTFRTRSQVPAS